MTPQPDSEFKGDLRTNPLAELLVEISNAQLSGSLRASSGDRKAVIYLKNGTVLYAVSNAREHRLFSLLIMQKKVGADVLKGFANPTNDHELATWLKDQNILPAADVNFSIIRQIETIISDALSWARGEWVFDPLTRARDGMKVAVDIPKLVMAHARTLSDSAVGLRFRPAGESFTPVQGRESKVTLQPDEMYVFERFGGLQMTMEQVTTGSPVPAADLSRSLYVLWLAGLLIRDHSTSAFDASVLETLKNTKYAAAAKPRATGEQKGDLSMFADRRTDAQRRAMQSGSQTHTVSDLIGFLARVENAVSFYEVLGIPKTATTEQIKRAYLTHARGYHPDKFHREAPDTLRRIHSAFSEIARAHETLKSEASRSAYDLKLKKEAEVKQRPMTYIGENETQAGIEHFEHGLAAIADDNYAEAATHFSRAVHSCPQSARFHAYFGKALSAAEQYQHKAETEFQTAAKIAPGNVEVRMMYIDFLIELDMHKRAEGELNRFLEIVPGNKEALDRLAKFTK
ncbi:MAG TPA: DnaJ domain-containing protein [Pyrinomonadaceae bacterium]|nr:DnaJ domain-containing protein [Pyrinomonadaceae bacterium]